MNITFSIIALVAALAATFFVDRNRDEPQGALARSVFSPIRLVTILLLPLIAWLISLWLGKKVEGMTQDAIGIGLGVLVAIVAEALDRGPEAVGPLALAVASTAIVHSFGKDLIEDVQLGLAVGLGLAAWMLSVGGRGRGASRAALIGIAAIAGDALGSRIGGLDAASLSGTSFGLVVVVAGLLSNALVGKTGQALLRGGLTVALLAGGAYAIGRSTGLAGDAWMIFLVAIGTGVVVHLLVGPDDKPDSFRFILATLIWLGAATVSFSEAQGYGMATALIGAAAVPLLLGNPRALLTLGPLASLVIYRIFREFFTEDTKSIDIGQHYALIGFGAGLVVPLLPVEWSSTGRADGTRGSIAALLWALLVIATPILAAVLLGSKGVIGFIFGLGFAGIVEGLRGGLRLETFGLALALAASTVTSYAWLDPLLDLDRKMKQRYLIDIAIVIAIVGIAIFLLSVRSQSTIESESSAVA